MGFKTRFKRFFDFDEEYYDEEQEIPADDETEPTAKHGKNVVSLQSVQQSAKMVLIEPRTYDEAQEVADHLKNRRSCVINMQRIPNDQAKRIVDFLSGTVYAIGGDIQKIGTGTFLCTPENVDVSGAISEFLHQESAEW
ncbi:cell division protein SepF [Salicibibacter cibarius]|uniref:Cell division protein SepF n=1 Tax=Salicibibacter cibarius TaxID=2743000 RepID=A0A7T6Z4S3_9BACI|nr:cell division protein SepF [Salicibibacter cibarius]QQK76722.1 cell division protein SepF [Salicibibacter cibarius]